MESGAEGVHTFYVLTEGGRSVWPEPQLLHSLHGAALKDRPLGDSRVGAVPCGRVLDEGVAVGDAVGGRGLELADPLSVPQDAVLVHAELQGRAHGGREGGKCARGRKEEGKWEENMRDQEEKQG